MRKYIYVGILTAVSAALAASVLPAAGPHAVKPAGGPTGTALVASPGGYILGAKGGDPKGWYTAMGANCYLVYSDYGIYGGIGYVEDYGFHYNLDVYSDPEHYSGLYAWTDSPSLYDYEDYVYTATCTPGAVSLPGAASSIAVTFAAKWNIEDDYDGCELVYSTEVPTEDNPEIWQNLHPTSAHERTGIGTKGQPVVGNWYYEDESADWVPGETADITSLAGEDIYLGFVFRSDQSNPVIHDGIYVDELRVVADGTTVVYENGFEPGDPGDEQWDMFRYPDPDTGFTYGSEDWGFTEPMPCEMNFLRAGEFVVGNSTSYVADAYVPDWAVERIYVEDGHEVVVFSNSGSVQMGDPEFEVSAHVYPQTDFVLVDCYVKSLRQGTTGGIYGGVLMWEQILHNPYETFNDDVVTYDAVHDMAIYKDPGGEGDPLVGLAYLTPGRNSSSVNFKNVMDFTDDATNFTLLSNGEHDYNGIDSYQYYWFVGMGDGPYSLTRCQTFRYTFALVGGDDLDNLIENYEYAEDFSIVLTDYTPVNITSTSLGTIKSMFR